MTSAYKLMFGILGEHYSGQTHIFIFIMGWGWKVVWDNVVQIFDKQLVCQSLFFQTYYKQLDFLLVN